MTSTFSVDNQISELDGFYIGHANSFDATDEKGAGLYLYDPTPNSNLLISSCAFFDCRAREGGAAYTASAGNVEFRSCTFTGNRAVHKGGAVYALAVYVTVDRCSFSENACVNQQDQPAYGGALAAEGFQTLGVSETDFLNNDAGDPSTSGSSIGGAIWAVTADYDPSFSVLMLDVTIINCRSLGPGGGTPHAGGAWLSAATITIDRCRVSSCMSGTSGGMHITGVTYFTMGNCMISNNTAGTDAGMYYLHANIFGSYSIYNCIFYGNSATSTGGGLNIAYPSVSGAIRKISNCILRDNSAGMSQSESAQLRFASVNNVDLEHSDVQGLSTPAFTAPAQMNIAVNPRFKDPMAGDFRLTVNSMPLIDDGTNNADTDASTSGIQPITSASLDFLGLPRIRPPSGTVDMGAIEFECMADLTCAGDANCDGMIGLADVGVLLAHWDFPTFPGTNGDLNEDGVVNLADLAIVIKHWTETCPP